MKPTFIQLTRSYPGQPVLINLKRLIFIEPLTERDRRNNEKTTIESAKCHVTIAGFEDGLYVDESYDQILKILGVIK